MTKSATAQGFRIHVAHLSDAEALPMLKGMRKRLPLTAETCPHYLLFAAEEIPNGARRGARGREGLIYGLVRFLCVRAAWRLSPPRNLASPRSHARLSHRPDPPPPRRAHRWRC